MASLREYRALHMRGTPGGMGAGLSPNALVLPERLRSMPLLTLGEEGWLHARLHVCTVGLTSLTQHHYSTPSLGLCFPAGFTCGVHTALPDPFRPCCVCPQASSRRQRCVAPAATSTATSARRWVAGLHGLVCMVFIQLLHLCVCVPACCGLLGSLCWRPSSLLSLLQLSWPPLPPVHLQVGHTLMAGSVYDALRTVYPNCYPVYELAGAPGWDCCN